MATIPALVAANGSTLFAAYTDTSNPVGQMSLYADTGLFGTGAEGNVVISSGTVTINRDMHYNNLTISGSGKLVTTGFRVFVSNVLDISAANTGAIQANGANGNAATGAVAGASLGTTFARTVPGALIGTAGATGVVGVPTVAGSVTASSFIFGGTAGFSSGVSGAGGAGTNAASSGGTGNTSANSYPLSTPTIVFVATNVAATPSTICPGGSSAGAGAGGGDGTSTGGGGGGGASGGHLVALYARFIQRGTNVATGIFQARGGNGGNGGSSSAGITGGGGGANGGGGGVIYLVTEQLLGATITNAFDVSAGNGGSGGSGFGTGIGGTGGNGGRSGDVQIINLSAATYFDSGTNGLVGATAGAAGAGTVGGNGGVGATLLVNL